MSGETPREERIRELARAIWEQEGRPEGQSERHWRMAEKAVEADEHAEPEVSMGQPKDEVPPPTRPLL